MIFSGCSSSGHKLFCSETLDHSSDETHDEARNGGAGEFVGVDSEASQAAIGCKTERTDNAPMTCWHRVLLLQKLTLHTSGPQLTEENT